MDLERKQLRLPVATRVFIEWNAPPGQGAAEITPCLALNVSAGGLQVALDRELSEQAYLHIGVEPPPGHSCQDSFFLAAQVRWCRPGDAPEQPWLAGLALLPSERSDLDRWLALISRLAP